MISNGDYACQALLQLILCLFLVLPITCLTLANQRHSGGPGTCMYQASIILRKKLILAYNCFKLFSLHVTLVAKGRKHLQLLLLVGRIVHKGQIC